MPKPHPQCYECKHFRYERSIVERCKAFPNGVPAAIFDGHHDHRKPYRGDGGVRFEPRGGKGE